MPMSETEHYHHWPAPVLTMPAEWALTVLQMARSHWREFPGVQTSAARLDVECIPLQRRGDCWCPIAVLALNPSATGRNTLDTGQAQ